MPEAFVNLALDAARRGGFPDFVPDACLVNRYSAGSRLTAHRDADEQNYAQPIVSVSLGLPASFAFYGLVRGGKGRSVALSDGDVLVWGGPARLVYHAVRPIKPGWHPLTGEFRYNLTFRHAR
jgi:alkylated DNA repair protein (DNA oxidative demethylase)